MKNVILRGVPDSLRQDGWWLAPIERTGLRPARPRSGESPKRYALHALLLAGLILAAQLPFEAAPAPVLPESDHSACLPGPDSGFHAARGLRSLASSPQPGTPL